VQIQERGIQTVFANVCLHNIRHDTGNDDGRQALHGKTTQNDFTGENDTGKWRIKGGANSSSRTRSHQDFDIPRRQSKKLACHAAQ
jgi:hypothetical protein